MADAVTSQTLVDSNMRAVIKLTNISDGTGETDVTKVDVSTLANAANDDSDRVAISEIEYSIQGGAVELAWNADADQTAVVLSGDGKLDKHIPNNAGTGVNGDINLSTINFANNSTYTLILELRKTAGYTDVDGIL